jgi:hypothetical protein
MLSSSPEPDVIVVPTGGRVCMYMT